MNGKIILLLLDIMMFACMSFAANYVANVTVSTFAGTAGQSGTTDGIGNTARFTAPDGITADSAGNLYVADSGNARIRKITPAGLVTTLANLTAQSDPPLPVIFGGIVIDRTGNLFVVETSNHIIRKITPAGVVSTLAGSSGSYGSTDGTGSAARFNNPQGISIDSAGNLYVADRSNHTIRKITSSGVVTTLAGSAGTSGNTDGTGSAARFNNPYGVAVDSIGNIFVADCVNSTIRKITSAGVVTTLAGSAGSSGSTDGIGNSARFFSPSGISVDSWRNVYVTDGYANTTRKITPVGVVSTLAGSSGQNGSTDGAGNIARFYIPLGITIDSDGNAYVADTSNYTIRKIVTDNSSLNVNMAQPPLVYINERVDLTATVTGTQGDIALLWNNNGTLYSGGLNYSTTFLAKGKYLVSLTVWDLSTGLHNTDWLYVIVDERSNFQQPSTLPVIDPAAGQMKDPVYPLSAVDMNNDDWNNRKNNGLIIITHGVRGKAADTWLSDMASAMISRLGNVNRPNICLFDWEEMANGSKLDKNKYNDPISNTTYSLADWIGDFIIYSYPYGMLEGLYLSNWIMQNIDAGRINPNAPIHLIGHSAGGFVVSTCGLILPGKIAQVTLLDTPSPNKVPFVFYPNHGRIERYISSSFGKCCTSFTSPGDINLCHELHVLFPHIFNDQELPIIPTSSFYYRGEVADIQPTPAMHSYAYLWYSDTVSDATIQNGFYYSPFLNNGFHGSSLLLNSDYSSTMAKSSSNTWSVALDDFDSFGDVASVSGVHRITEQADAGIYKTLIFPAGTEMLSFRYAFASAGDGEFLTVHIGTNEVLYIGPNIELTRVPTNMTATVDVSQWAGQEGELIFKLVSRGTTNVVLTIDNIILDGEIAILADVSASDRTYADRVRVTWTASSNSACYQVWRNNDNVFNSATNLGMTIGTNYDDTTAVPGNVYYYWVTGTNTLGVVSTFGGPDTGIRRILSECRGGDYDGDRKADPAIELDDGTWYIWFSASGYQTGGPYALGGTGWTPISADLDGDGKADPAMIDGVGNWYVWFSASGYTRGGPYSLGHGSWIPLAGDFDGDGKADPAAVDGSGNWYIWFSVSGYVEGGPYALGQSGWTPVAGDFDGDGKADPSVVDGSGNWNIWYSSSGYSMVSGSFDVSGGMPMAGDFDGDGKADPAMIDGVGNWYVWFSSVNYQRSGPFLLTVP